MVSLPLSLTDSIARTASSCAPRRPLGRHPVQALVIPLLLLAGVARAPGDPIAGAALIGTSAALLALKWPTTGMSSWRLEVGLAGHLALAVLTSGWYTMEGAVAGAALGMTGARVTLAAIGAGAVLFSVLELVSRVRLPRQVSPEAIGPLQPFLSQVAEVLEQMLGAIGRDDDADGMQRARRRGRAYRHHLSNLAMVARTRPLAEGVGPVVATLWELLDPATMPFPVDKIRVHRDIGPGELMVKVPGPFLEMLFWNLADNAFRACAGRPEGAVSVSAKRSGNIVEVTFGDDGVGMTAAEQERAFTPLTVGRNGSLHLGLAAARKIARSYGGRLELASRPEGGTVVTVTLPLVRER